MDVLTPIEVDLRPLSRTNVGASWPPTRRGDGGGDRRAQRVRLAAAREPPEQELKQHLVIASERARDETPLCRL